MYRVDLHSHSSASPDGGITAAQYHLLIERQVVQQIAITDHNRIDFALRLKAEMPEHIIVGEEITAKEGEIVGLFLSQAIPAGLSAAQTAKAIKAQGGIVYIPHPLETVRKGLPREVLDNIANMVDIVEAANGRAVVQNRGPQALTWAKLHHKPAVGSSDAHGIAGVGRTYTSVPQLLTRDTCLNTLKSGFITFAKPPLHSLLYPKFNRVRKHLRVKHD